MEASSGASLELAQKYPIEEAVALEANPGDLVFFNYLTLHGSMPNRSDDVRKTVLVQMHAGDDEIENPEGHPYDKWVLAGRNHHMSRVQAGIIT